MGKDLFRVSLFFAVILACALSCMAISCRVCNEFPHGSCCDSDFPGTCKADTKFGVFVAALDVPSARNDSCQWMSFTWTQAASGIFISSCAERWDDSIAGQTYRVWWQSQFNGSWNDKFSIKCQ
eukprot:TRINITY_DN1210_c0_g1_i1.p2 TRINITY_DN1210_c0_g1~~TRINITY_DN1210_c0_g1_i1.p2  ORF type:complete len:140 (+),score=12.14 TRINITY_DN1210_c0_g1_i1:51-422(+)